MAYRGQQLLCALIRLYQRRCSGRGPLRQVVCTFRGSERCSDYGLRAAAGAASLPEALRLIRGRLRRCASASLYRHRGGLLWGELYDDVAFGESGAGRRLCAALDQVREAPATAALVLHGAARVAAQVGRARLARGLLGEARRRHPGAVPVLLPPLRDGRRLLPSLRRRLLRRLVAPLAAPLLCAWAWPRLALGLVLLLALPLMALALWRHRARRGRFVAIGAALQFQGAFRLDGGAAGG